VPTSKKKLKQFKEDLKEYLCDNENGIQLKLPFAYNMTLDGDDFLLISPSNIDRFESREIQEGLLGVKILFKKLVTSVHKDWLVFDVTPLVLGVLLVMARKLQEEKDECAERDRVKSRAELLDLE
jgi:hypothetical protein